MTFVLFETWDSFEILLRNEWPVKGKADSFLEFDRVDLSSNLASKAVATLTDFDHESVFEAILLACADPTREVRAAAARGLFRLNFDRADAWKRIIESNDEFRIATLREPPSNPACRQIV